MLALPARLPTSLLWDVYDEKEVAGGAEGIVLALPPQSGRVYLYRPSPTRGLDRNRHALTVRTEPSLGKTRFELDGQPMMTYGGRWTTEYIKGPNFGNFIARFDQPGWHTVTVIDETRQEMLVANSYQDAYALNETVMPGATSTAPRDPERLGKYMDPRSRERCSRESPSSSPAGTGRSRAGRKRSVFMSRATRRSSPGSKGSNLAGWGLSPAAIFPAL